MGSSSVRGSKYPTPSAIAQTIAHDGTSLQGSRRFYSASGVVVYAYDRMGMANTARRTWLPPSATRRLSTFLDMVSPAVGGLLMHPAGVQAPQFNVGGPTTAAGRLRELAEAHLQQSIGATNQTLCAINDSPDGAWEWSGVLFYDHKYRLRTGEYTTSRPPVTFHVRPDEHPTRAHILVELRRPTDFKQVQKWIGALLPAEERWAALPLAFLDGQERHGEIRSVVDAIGSGGEVQVAQGNTQRSSASLGLDSHIGEFEQTMKEGHYKTSMHGLDALITRAETVDFGVVTAFDLYHWHGSDKKRVAARVRVKQHGTDPLTIEWGAVREPRTQAGVPLSGPVALASSWEDMTAAEWPDEERMAHLRHLWSQLIGALQSDAGSIAA
jgi:hypothetical protein